MNQPIKILIMGVLIAALIATAGFLNSYYLESKLHTLESECAHGKSKEKDNHNELDFSSYGKLVCDSEELRGIGKLKGIQAQILQNQNDIWLSKKWYYSITLLVLIVSAAPLFWYFLLQRIREIRNVIVGK